MDLTCIKCYPVVIGKATKWKYKDTQWYEDQLKREKIKLTKANKYNVISDAGYLQKIKLIRASLFNKTDIKDFKTNKIIMYYDYALRFDKKFKNDIQYIAANRILHNSTVRKSRLKKRIEIYKEFGECYFITLTFEEKYLKLTEFTRRRYVTRYLSSISNFYIANIDYGEKKGREHYHGIIQLENPSIFNWKYGFFTIKKVGSSSLSDSKLSEYIDKLVLHAFKESGKQKRIIYSKNSFKEIDFYELSQEKIHHADYLLQNKERYKNNKEFLLSDEMVVFDDL